MRWFAIIIFVGACAQIANLRDDPRLVASAGEGGSSSATASNGGAGGEATMCDPSNVDACGEQNKCTIVDEDTGAFGCAPRGTQTAYEVCQDDGECVAGTYCGPNWGSCRPFCRLDEDCDGGLGRCEPALGPSASASWKVCIAMCDPVLGGRCGTGTACGQLEPNHQLLWECYASLGLADGQNCDGTFGACADGLTCHGGQCRPYCYLDAPSPPGCTCQNVLGQFSVFGGRSVGVCL